jgi:hypothetical protein
MVSFVVQQVDGSAPDAADTDATPSAGRLPQSERSTGPAIVLDRVGSSPVIDAACPFGELRQALAHQDRGAFGKIVVTLA